MKKLLLIINNKTRTLNSTNTFNLVKHFSNVGYMVIVYPIANDIELDFDSYLTADKYEKIVCLGGDGTLNRTINGILKNNIDTIIGYIPAGTTNDFAKNLNLTDNVDIAKCVITDGEALSYDIGRFNERYFNYVACFGAFSDISYSTDQSFKNLFGYAAYALTAISNLSENLSSKCHVCFELENQIIEDDYVFGALCNSLSVAGMKIDGMTEDELHDGKFELFLIKCPKNTIETAEIVKSLLNKDFNNPYCSLQKVDKVKIYANENVYWTLDGEPGGNPTKVEFSLIPGAVKIMVNKQQHESN